jgi:hypothetical protein
MIIQEAFLKQNDCWIMNQKVEEGYLSDSRYAIFQQRGPTDLMLHSTGTPQPNADVFVVNWNKSGVQKCVHAFIDANSGVIKQTLKWNYRGWHAAGSANNTHIGVEMCETKWIKYTSGGKFEILDTQRAQADCARAYKSAVELFAYLCKEFHLNPLTNICSHKEGGKKGIASGHVDPEHYWTGLGMPYTMDTFRRDVKNQMEGEIDVTRDELDAYLDSKVLAIRAELEAEYQEKLGLIVRALTNSYQEELETVSNSFGSTIDAKIEAAVGKEMVHVSDIPWKGVRATIQKLLDADAINGGTPKETDPDDIRLPLELVRVLAVMTAYVDKRLEEENSK